ncbi:uncharacterized protein SCHCODRAFT_02627910 [Schizophyllum commune H4-8]|uniref:uncharacterized protein n=1 Tax=Schizophyllum commune (strain H4-8 / FGSC 9210) TaxID=578458 RepID=UPI0021610197|nr:uncharacterized protein SCHCODRAFT_02627910 [Schizophyllum commune H4-8]KAI5891021.1 hypothetical protein SCHCODRAFT_02627910 [Schizophyllum commune H4-8]
MQLDGRDPSSFTRTPAFVRCLSEPQNPLCTPHRMIPLLQGDLSPVVLLRSATSICDVSVVSCTITRCTFCGAARRDDFHLYASFAQDGRESCPTSSAASYLPAKNWSERFRGSSSQVSRPFLFSADPLYTSALPSCTSHTCSSRRSRSP